MTNAVADLSSDQLITQLKTDEHGLTESEARNRLTTYGLNVFHSTTKRSIGSLVLKQFKSSLIYLLIVASALSFFLDDINDGFVILGILLINTSLGFYQEYKSENAVEKLQKLVSKEILVMREGKETLTAESHLVPGDRVILRQGDIVPADMKLVKTEDLSVNESQLTGESAAVAKSTTGANSLVFAGSTIEQGEGEGYVYAIGESTQLGQIAHLSTATKRVTQYEKSLTSFSNFLIKVTFLTLALVFVFKLTIAHDSSGIASLGLFVIALSITVVPEAMPVIATVTLSSGAMKLAQQHVIAKTLSAVEDLGNINILCSDKTGTLTENKQTVTKLIAEDPILFQRLAIASLESLDEKRKKFQSSFDKAFISFVPEAIQQDAHEYKRLKELPFDPMARRRRVVISDGHKKFLVEVGSVETLLELTDDSHKEKYLKIIAADGKLGLRHLGIAYKEVKYSEDEDFDILQHEKKLLFVGFVALEDPLRPTAKHTIALAEKLGITLKILSGDSREVTQYVASEVGLLKKHQIVYTGDELEKLSDEHLKRIVLANNAFARLSPEQKYRIIKVLKSSDNVVGYQGDGINDAPALKLADVAIAVNNATDVAQESADILLLHNDLNVIVNGILYGRTIFLNIGKYIRYTMIGNFGNFFALSTLYLLSNSGLPLLPVQLLLTNLLSDIPLITIATDNVDQKDLIKPSKFSTHSLMFISIFLGSITALFEIVFFGIVRNQSIGIEQTSLFLFLTLSGLIIIFSVRTKGHFWKAPKMSTNMKIAFTIIGLLSIALVYIGLTKDLFSFTRLPLKFLAISVAMTAFYLYILDVIKVWFFEAGIGGNTAD